MFKPGEIAVVRGSERRVTIVAGPLARAGHEWPVATNEGVFDETELFPAHPSVLATAEGRDLGAEAFHADMEARQVVEDAAEDTGAILTYNLREKVGKALSKATVDLNGHWRNGENIHPEFKILDHVMLSRTAMSKAEAEAILRAVKNKTPLEWWIPVDLYLSSLRKCPLCGEEDFGTETNGLVVRLSGDRCKYENGLPLTEWELNVPSGKIVVANDLRELFPLPEAEDFDINTTLGCAQTALAYAAAGMSHAFVGNTCPGVYKCSDGSFKIANEPQEEEWNGEKYVPIDPPPVFDGEHMAGICTDLWWYSIADNDEFERRVKHFKIKRKNFNIKVIAVRPGVYRFRHDEEARGHEGPGETVYTRFEWVREPDPVKDFLGTYESVDVNPHAFVQAQVKRWPTLYGKRVELRGGKEATVPWSDMAEEDRISSWQRVADHIFCTIGGGTSWHEKGFPRAKVDPTVPDVEPPSFREQHHWYPFSKPYGGMFEPHALAPGFAKLLFRVLESVISFGMHVRDDNKGREIHSTRKRMLEAVKRYRELALRYPDQADPEYVAWLGQKGRAEAWVKNFDLGPEVMEKHREHVRKQRWVPENAYAIEFDARKLKSGHFAWHPKEPSVGGCWARKENAQRYAILAFEDNGQPAEHNCFWTCHATNTSVPLYSVARVVKVGEVSHMGETLVELAFDYGTPWMQDVTKRKAVVESGEKAAIKILSREEYENLLPKAKEFFEMAEAAMAK